MAGRILQIDRLAFTQIDSLDREKTVFIIPVSPLEEHGPHLPIGVDAMNAAYFAEHTAKLIIKRYPEFDILLFPLLPVGTQVYKHIGSFYFKPSTLYDVVYSTGHSLALYGFRNILVLSAHGTPKQIVAIETACKKVAKRNNVRMISLAGGLTVKFMNGEMYDAIAKKLGREFSDEEKILLKYDYHAGWWETSMMLLTKPELVHKSYTDNKPYLKDHISGEILTPDDTWQGYYGAPAKASKEFAEASVEAFTEYAIDFVRRSLEGEDVAKEINSPFGKYLIYHPFFKRNLYIGIAVAAFLVILLLLVLHFS